MGFNWRPHYNPGEVKRELQIIREDLHCTAVRISGQDFDRLTLASRYALEQGLEVWFYPIKWDRSAADTLAYLTRAARVAEDVRQMDKERVVSWSWEET